MDSASFDFETIFQERRENAAASMKPISHEALEDLGARLFTVVDHPWHQRYLDFLSEHKDSPAVHGSASDLVEFVYFPRENKGLWFRMTGGVTAMGPIAERGLNALGEIVAEKNLG